MKERIKDKLRKYKLIVSLYRKLRGTKREGTGWEKVAKQLKDKQILFCKDNPSVETLHLEIDQINKKQISEWGAMVYCGGALYQGYNKLGLFGVKPTEDRLERYDAFRYINSESCVLDIGSNAGFMSCEIATKAKSVLALEYNNYLNEIGRATANHLDLKNVEFLDKDFQKFSSERRFDCVLSLSNHHTIDGGLNISFEQYINKIYNLMADGGILLFESHNVWVDDSDLAEKFKIASKYFELERSKMVEAFFKPDIDKLFAVFRRRDQIFNGDSLLNFDFSKAIEAYDFIEY
ncbi:class I SAM-dependent methyltransferase [Thiosulfativibrio zosterae]|uniref:Methyltransferase domain-containing protein n=1 Tax=Thiosulfativibrio zosterae TaxID=2675053 RepID=A0A6F8PM26_9GAMM|nr:class I SAM-dependent methyltransferase [Thiosulfativibrio zosterae]BBP43050.1 hypothetical protein THMIRHAT_07960 [Thiosulfativibrio zosterae]